MQKIILFLIIALVLLDCGYSQEGALDRDFSGLGYVLTDFDSTLDFARAIAIQPDSKIILGGYSERSIVNNPSEVYSYADFALARYHPDGTLDNDFGNNGKLINPLDSDYNVIHDIALQDDGKIVAAGYKANYEYRPGLYNSPDSSLSSEFALARFLSNGRFDNDFGDNGVVTVNLDSNGVFRSVLVQPDGKILAGGDCEVDTIAGKLEEYYVVTRFNSNGSLDESFGKGGIAKVRIGKGHSEGHSLLLQPDGKILLAGHMVIPHSFDFGVLRLNSDGSLDSTFNKNGKVSIQIGNDSKDQCRSAILQEDGKILLAGFTLNKSDFDIHIALARLNSDGTMDNSFGAQGIVTTSIDGHEKCYAVAIQPDNKIIATGYTGEQKIALVRYETNGSLDSSFGNTGIRIINSGKNFSSLGYDVAIDCNGRILVGGYSYKGSIIDFSLFRFLSGLDVGMVDAKRNKNDLLVYPNPLDEYVNLQFELGMNQRVSIFLTDLNGRVIKTFVSKKPYHAGSTKINLNFSDIPQGYYLITVSGKNFSKSVQVLK